MLLNLGGGEIGENLQEQILKSVLNSIRFLFFSFRQSQHKLSSFFEAQ